MWISWWNDQTPVWGWKFFEIADELERLLGRHVDLGTRDALKEHASMEVPKLRVQLSAAVGERGAEPG